MPPKPVLPALGSLEMGGPQCWVDRFLGLTLLALLDSEGLKVASGTPDQQGSFSVWVSWAWRRATVSLVAGSDFFYYFEIIVDSHKKCEKFRVYPSFSP